MKKLKENEVQIHMFSNHKQQWRDWGRKLMTPPSILEALERATVNDIQIIIIDHNGKHHRNFELKDIRKGR